MPDKSVLNIPLRKVHALEIIRGEKKREYRAFTDHWASRLCLFEDPEDRCIMTGFRQFDHIHFYPYNNKWYLDVEIQCIDAGAVDEEFMEIYGSEVDVKVGDQIIVIHLGKVIATNLTA